MDKSDSFPLYKCEIKVELSIVTFFYHIWSGYVLQCRDDTIFTLVEKV